ncbi:MAG: hypothetical protein LBC74_04770 [Planctomycetaceae bacterium]|nr:hypothetical protein [Planctomycetaceae bacterium]
MSYGEVFAKKVSVGDYVLTVTSPDPAYIPPMPIVCGSNSTDCVTTSFGFTGDSPSEFVNKLVQYGPTTGNVVISGHLNLKDNIGPTVKKFALDINKAELALDKTLNIYKHEKIYSLKTHNCVTTCLSVLKEVGITTPDCAVEILIKNSNTGEKIKTTIMLPSELEKKL